MPNAPLTKNLPYKTQRLLKKMPQHIQKIGEQIISDQQILKQLDPKILRTILNTQLEQMFQEHTRTQDQKITKLTESKITTARTAYLNNQLQLFSPDELKKTIYRYNENVTKITDLSKKSGNIDLLNNLTNILEITAGNTNPNSD